MSRLSPSPFWQNPHIPIYVDTPDTQERKSPEENPEYTCPTCAISSRDQPIHCVSHASHASPAPPSYRSVVSQPSSTGRLAVPELNVITTQSPRPQAPRPTFQFDPEGRPNLRFRRNAFSPLTPRNIDDEDIDWSRKSHVGLGIPEAQFKPDASPITPGTAENRGQDGAGSTQEASNFAQRIEQKLWKYSASGNVVKRWLIEIISWLLSAICMAGIIGMLFYYKDERIPKWPLGLTLNAYISVLSKVASAALLLPVSEALGQLKWSWFQGDNSKKMWDFEIFDNASRGPWGSLLLLVRTKGRSLAALGAAVTLFALALDPFFQQVVEYPERWRLQEGLGSIPKSVAYESSLSGIEYRMGVEMIELDPAWLGSTWKYFYDSGSQPITFGKGVRAEVPLSCPSSNCTWPEYETLGVCTECAEASDQLEFKCLNTTMDWVQIPDLDDTGIVLPNGTACGWWLKADLDYLMTGYNIDPDTAHTGELLITRTQPMYDIMTRDPIPGYIPKINNTRNPLAHAIIVSGENLENIRLNMTPIATECLLKWCVKSVISNYSEGGYNEVITNIVTNQTLDHIPWQITELYNDKREVSGVDYVYTENVTIVGDSGMEYFVDNRSHVYALSLFDDVFPSTYTLINDTDISKAMLRYKQYSTVPPTRNMTHNPYLYSNVSKHLESMATALTNTLRSSARHTEQITGPAFEQESFVDVRWAWLALPLSLLSLTFLFLVATVIRSSVEQEHVGVWKTSAIATLLYGLPDEMQKKITSSKQTGTPRAKAKEIKLKWLPKSGWRFSGNSALSPSFLKARQTLTPTEPVVKSGTHLSPPSHRSSSTTLIATPSLKSPTSTPSFPTVSRAPSVKSMSSSPTLECQSTSSSIKSPPTPPLESTTVSPPVSPFEPSFPTPPLGSCTPSPPFPFYNHPSPLASNPSLPLDSEPKTQTYYERNPSAYYRTAPQTDPGANSQAFPQLNVPVIAQPSPRANHQANLQVNHQANAQASPRANHQENRQASPPTNPQAGSPPPNHPFRSLAR